MYKVYMHITPDNKKYIGVTKNSLKRRWGNGSGYKRQQLFYEAIKKYGWSNIKHIILYDNLTEEEASKKERELISFFNTNDIKQGFNCTHGGETKKTASIETRLKLSKVLQHKNKKDYKHFKEEIRHRTGKPVICIETQIIFPRIKDASEYYEICDETIRKCCHSERFTAGGYHWSFYEEGSL